MLARLLKILAFLGAHFRCRKVLRRAFAHYAQAQYAEACALCEETLRLDSGFAHAHFLLGLIACRGGDPHSGAAAIRRALDLAPDNSQYLAALADAQLLQQFEEEALATYPRAFPHVASQVSVIGEPASPWKKTHPDWIRRLQYITLPEPLPGTLISWYPTSLDDTAPGHLLNWALLLIRRRRVRAAIFLIEEALRAHSGLGYAYAVLTLLHTLDQDWHRALAAGYSARGLRAEVYAGATDYCILSAQLGLGVPASKLDPIFEWRAFSHADTERRTNTLPQVCGLPFPRFDAGVLVYFICCESTYLFEHAIALICSIRHTCREVAIHLHLFDPSPEAWDAVERLRLAAAPLPLSVTWEAVSFEAYGGKAVYCSCSRFVRLHELTLGTDARVVMLDADSLVRADLAPALANTGDVGLIRAENEPLWNRYFAGFTTFRKSPLAAGLLGELSGFMAANLEAGRAQFFMDQLGLFICASRWGNSGIEHLPMKKFCDTLFTDDAFVWTVTQRKAEDSRYMAYKQAVRARYDATVGSPPAPG